MDVLSSQFSEARVAMYRAPAIGIILWALVLVARPGYAGSDAPFPPVPGYQAFLS